MIVKKLCNLDNRKKLLENIYMQYFLDYPCFSSESIIDTSIFVDVRKQLGLENLNTAINERMVSLKTKQKTSKLYLDQQGSNLKEPENEKEGIYVFSTCPEYFVYPTDLNLLSDLREKPEELIDLFYAPPPLTQ